jgi:hypothetical protein
MYSTYVLGFGIGWCLAYVILLIILSNKIKTKKTDAPKGTDGEIIKKLIEGMTELKNHFGDVRFDELKNRENAYSRNPKGFNYDFQGFFKDIDDRVKGLDGDLSSVIKKCDDYLNEISREKRVSQSVDKQTAETSPFAVVNVIGILGILIANFIYFTKIF